MPAVESAAPRERERGALRHDLPPEVVPDLAADIHETKAKVKAPNIAGKMAEGFDWAGLAPAPPDPETAEAQAADAEFEERVGQATAMHAMVAAGARNLFLTTLGQAELNGMPVPMVSDQPMVKEALADTLQESALRVAVKYLPDDMQRPAYYDEMVVVGLLGGSTSLAIISKRRLAEAPHVAASNDQEAADSDDIDEDSVIDVSPEGGPEGMIRV